ncbi:uncharacterized protein LOC111318169 isoform X2 [Durio zibethinus]|uniref:Uncharacterized protein LOC111318169 isoform X2 n=1 Tax=Durio zibethinus TaxID=66656 RepID=A0A6P6BHK8_DURZI|nr:uncharacterized protein LOC111318169 isoform X2 [Durio zibethinus]
MVEVGGDEGTRRRLPLWMQGIASKPANDRDKNDKVQEDRDGLVCGNSKPIKQSKKAALPQEKGETQRRKRKIIRQDAACDVESASPKKMSISLKEKQVLGSSLQRKRKASCVRLRSGKDSKIPSPVEDDNELTPEDLLSIAEEYVKADKDVVLEELSIRECEFGRQLSTTASSKTESESSLIALDGNRRSPALKTTHDSTQSPKNEKNLINTSRTEDPAQDMLDLFLGPLLKKTEEKRTEFGMRYLPFSNELGKGSQNDVKEETAPLTKKKCTLRDKKL